MDMIDIPGRNIRLSRLGLGTVKFGRNTGVKYPQGFDLPDDYTIQRLLTTAQECGINLLDTAAAYGTSEERLGALLIDRARWVIVTKAGEDFENSASRHDFSPAHITLSLERSLKRLNTDYIDIFLIHSDGSDLKILSDDKLLRTLESFRAKGIVRALGMSSKTVEGGVKSLELFDTAMVTYSPVRAEDKPVLDRAHVLGKPVLLKKILDSGHNPDVGAALTHAYAHPAATAAIIGTLSPERLRQNALAAEAALSSALFSSSAGAPAA